MSTLRDRRRRTTEGEIEAAAIALFEDRGYEATTCPDIAEAADVSPRTFYRYGKNKEEVAFRTAKRFNELLSDVLCERVADSRRLTLTDCNTAIVQVLAESAAEAWLERMLRVRRLTARDAALRRIAQHQDAECAELIVQRVAAQCGADAEGALRIRVVTATALALFRTALDEWIAARKSDGAQDLLAVYRQASVLLGDEIGSGACPTTSESVE